MVYQKVTFLVLDDIKDVVEFVVRSIEQELTNPQLSNLQDWDIQYVADINEDDDGISIIDLEDFFEDYVTHVVNRFNIDLDFSFLETNVATELTQIQIITILKEVNSFSKTNSETVTLHRLREKYKNAKTFLELSFIIEDEPDILKILEIMSMDQPVNVDGEIIESGGFVWLTGDGRHSNRGWDIYFDPSTKALYKESWSKWQGEGSYYDGYSIQRFLELLEYTIDVSHLRRHIKGFKQYISSITE